MNCPTCDYQMHMVGIWWCPRCGTILLNVVTSRPKLVDICREMADKWHGINELIYPEEK